MIRDGPDIQAKILMVNPLCIFAYGKEQGTQTRVDIWSFKKGLGFFKTNE